MAPRVAHREALAGHAVEERLAAGGAVERHVADEDVLFRQEGGAARRIDDQPAAGEALADVVVGVAFQFQRHARWPGSAEALAGRAGELEADGVVGQARASRSGARSRPRAWRPRCGACCGSAA